MSVEATNRRLAALLVADVVGYSRLLEEDEASTLTAIAAIRNEIVRPLLDRFRGRVVKLLGDGLILEFGSIVDAVNCAVEIQRAVAARADGGSPARRIVLRIGVNLGDVVVDGDDLLGDGLNIAARLEQLCQPGGLLVSGTAHDHLAGRIALPVTFVGEQHVKNISRPVRVYRVEITPGHAVLPGVTRRLGRVAWRWPAILVLAALVAGGLFWARREPAEAARPSIAVLAFDNLSNDPADAFVTEGIGEDIITELARNRDLKVLARPSSMSLRGADKTPEVAGPKLGVRYLLDGSVRRAGESLRLTVRLVEASSQGSLWNEHFDVTAADLVSTQDAIVSRIAGTLFSEVRQTEKAASLRRPPNSLEVYDLAVRGLALKHKLNGEAFREGRIVLEQAIRLDPDYAPAYAYLGLLDAIDAVSGFTGARSRSDMDAAIALTRKSVELDPTFAYGHQALGYALCLKGDCLAGLRALEQAVELGPSDADNQLFLGYALASNGQFERAIAAGELAFSLNPLTPLYYHGIHARALFGAARYEEVLQVTQVCIDRQFYQRSCRLARIAALQELGWAEKAKAEMADFLAHAPGFSVANAAATVGYSNAPKADTLILDALKRAGLPE